MKKQGFTLAEVLITLAIIGVVAAMTIPSVIVRTNQQEFKTGAKKAYSVLSSAIQLVEAQDGLTFADEGAFVEALINRMNVIKVETGNYETYIFTPGSALALGSAPSVRRIFYTADGFRYEIEYMNEWGAQFYVDVNGDKGPSTYDSGYKEATFDDWDDIENPEWPNVHLSDVFDIYFDENGHSEMRPFTGYPA